MKKIIIIEDDVRLQKLYQEALSRLGYQVSTFSEGQAGLLAIGNEKPNLVVLDIMLPGGMNGFDVLEQLKRADDTKQIPVIVLTNLDSEKKVALEIGATDYLVKANTTMEQILGKVKALLG